MSVTIKPNKMKYKDSSGNYVGVNAIAERTTAEEVADIQAVSTTAQGEITALTTAKKTEITNLANTKKTEIDNKATEVTSQLANAAEVRNMLAGTFSTSTNYTKGQYVIQTVTVSGNSVNKLYRFTADHPAGNWLGTDVVEVKLADDVSSLSSAIGTVPTGKTVQGQIDALENGLEKGTYEDLTAGNALYLLSDRGDTDVEPYVFRKTGGAKNGYGREFLRKIVGGTVAWNQLTQNGNFASGDGWAAWNSSNASLTIENNIATMTFLASGYGYKFGIYKQSICNIVIGHKYVITAQIKPSVAGNYGFDIDGNTTNKTKNLTANVWQDLWVLFTGSNGGETGLVIEPFVTVSANDTLQIKNVQLFDLTQMFGSAIADAISAMETATPGSGVAWFRSLFPNSYYAYDAGSLQSVQAKEHRTTGFNQWDEQWELGIYGIAGEKIENNTCFRSTNKIPVIPNTQYCFTMPNNTDIRFRYYAKNGQYVSSLGANTSTKNGYTFTIPDGIYYMAFYVTGTQYKNDICINLSDLAKNGTYEPYSGHTYPLDSSLTLRGIPAWDSTNWLYYDGDEYTPDGSVKRKYGIVDLGTLDWTYAISGVSGKKYFKSAAVSEAKADTLLLVCQKGYTPVASSSVGGTNMGISIIVTKNIWIRDDTYENYEGSDFKTAMSGVYLVYELATPATETADAFRELEICNGNGTEEFIDAGVTATTPTRDVSVPVGTETFYPIDVVAYIEELTNPDHDMVADALIPSGKYFMVGNSLYKSTSQIQAGATIIPGSNCTAKTLAEALNELNT